MGAKIGKAKPLAFIRTVICTVSGLVRTNARGQIQAKHHLEFAESSGTGGIPTRKFRSEMGPKLTSASAACMWGPLNKQAGLRTGGSHQVRESCKSPQEKHLLGICFLQEVNWRTNGLSAFLYLKTSFFLLSFSVVLYFTSQDEAAR